MIKFIFIITLFMMGSPSEVNAKVAISGDAKISKRAVLKNMPADPDFPVVESVNNLAVTTGSFVVTVTLPAGINAGDLIVIGTNCSDKNLFVNLTWPAGWTKIFEAEEASSHEQISVGLRVADGSEGATIALSSNLDKCNKSIAVGYVITGATGSYQVSTANTGTSSSPNTNSVTPSWGLKNTMWISMFSNLGGKDIFTSPPTGYGTITFDQNGTSGGGSAVATSHRFLRATTHDPGAYSLSETREWVGATIAICPGN